LLQPHVCGGEHVVRWRVTRSGASRARIRYPRFPRRVATPSSVTPTLSTTTTCTILMQITATVQGSALSNESKLQLDSSVGTYRDRYLEVQSTQGGCDEVYTRVRVDLVPSQPRLRAGLGSRPGIEVIPKRFSVLDVLEDNPKCLLPFDTTWTCSNPSLRDNTAFLRRYLRTWNLSKHRMVPVNDLSRP
jgi:hypothetical protein